MCYLCRLITPPGGTILDPWMGSGSTGKACGAEGFSFIGMEMDEKYFKIAQARVSAAYPNDDFC
jgi:site-specific DNA-methyltransferase (adenine-specific)